MISVQCTCEMQRPDTLPQACDRSIQNSERLLRDVISLCKIFTAYHGIDRVSVKCLKTV